MERVKIVVRYVDGRIMKGHCQDFSPTNPQFHLLHEVTGGPEERVKVLMKDLKAVFFVRDFEGNPKFKEQKQFAGAKPPSGRKVEITFADGEVLVGSTVGYDPQRSGFFIFPADPQSNNLRVFVISAAVSKVRFL